MSQMAQSSSKIPRRISAEDDRGSSKTEVKKQTQETRKISLTDQGKAAKLLRQRLALALGHNTKIKSDSSNSESDPETIGKGVKGTGERKSSIPRKISQGVSQDATNKPPQAQHLLGARSERVGGERSRSIGAVQPLLTNGVGNVQQENNSKANLSSATHISRFSSDINNEMITKDNTALTLSRVQPNRDESLPIIHETAATKAEDVTLAKQRNNLDVIESELVKLKVQVNKTLVDFQEMNAATEHVKKKLEELRRDRIRAAS